MARYYVIQNGAPIIGESEENLIRLFPDSEVNILPEDYTPIDYKVVDGELVKDQNAWGVYRANEIAHLFVTRLDFINILEDLGLVWSNMKAIMAQYPEVEKELTMCSNVYRGNPLIDNMIPLINQTFSLNITTVDLDNAFIEKCGRTDLQRTE